MSHMLKSHSCAGEPGGRRPQARAIIEDLRASKMSKAANLVEQSVHETLTYYAFPDIDWEKIRTNNPLERIMKKSVAEPAWSVPSGRSVLPGPAAARLRYIAGTAWSTSAT